MLPARATRGIPATVETSIQKVAGAGGTTSRRVGDSRVGTIGDGCPGRVSCSRARSWRRASQRGGSCERSGACFGSTRFDSNSFVSKATETRGIVVGTADMVIRTVTEDDTEAVVALWQRVGLRRPWNDPRKDIARKGSVQPELFLVAVEGSRIVGTVMAGYDGHRGWVNYLAVDPDWQRRGLGRRLMAEVESGLVSRGCPKINLQVHADNRDALAFYERLGFTRDEVMTLGKRLERDD